jgi:hypothetical protein
MSDRYLKILSILSLGVFQNERRDPVLILTGPYLSTGMEIDQSESIILTTMSADVQ